MHHRYAHTQQELFLQHKSTAPKNKNNIVRNLDASSRLWLIFLFTSPTLCIDHRMYLFNVGQHCVVLDEKYIQNVKVCIYLQWFWWRGPNMLWKMMHLGYVPLILEWCIWMFPKIGVPQNGWFIMENHIKMDDLGYHYFWKHPYNQANLQPLHHLPKMRHRSPVTLPHHAGDRLHLRVDFSNITPWYLFTRKINECLVGDITYFVGDSYKP